MAVLPSTVMSRIYVALGDSISIDDYAGGPGRGAASLLHHNRDTDFPEWTGDDLASAGYDIQALARDGAVADNVLRLQLPLIRQRPNVVTLSMGGNDLLSAYGDTAAAEEAVDSVAELADTVLAQLRAIAGTDAYLVVTTVYDPSDGTGLAGDSGFPPWPDGPALVRALNDALVASAGRHAALVADVHDRFHGHGVTAGDPGQPEARPANRELWYCGLVEPNAWGANEIRATWWHVLRQAGAVNDASR